MVRHIVRKDWRLLWPLVVALAAFQILLAAARFAAGHFVNLPTVPASLLSLAASGIVTMLVVLEDAVPGVQHDWLIRPIRRRDLVLAKLLFVVVFVQGPWWIADVTQGLVNGFSLSQSAGAATACTVWVLLTMTIPLLAFAALASTVTQTIIGALALFAMMIVFLMGAALVGASRPALLTGFAWVPALVRETVLLAAAGTALILQYGGRRTAAARAVFVVAFVVGQSAPLLPWGTTVRLHQLLTGARQDDHGVAIAFAPAAGRFRPAPGQNLDEVAEKPGVGSFDAAEESQRRRAEGARTILFPMRVSGLPPDSRLRADHSDVTVVTADGRRVFRGTGNDLEFRPAGPGATVHHGVRIPGALYRRIHAETLDVQLDYWFTLLLADPTYALAASGGNQRMPGIGWCATKVDDAGTRVLLQCLRPGERPSCLSVALEHAPTRRRNPEVSLCAPDYSPYPGHVLPDALSRFGGRLPFYDPSGVIRYPVGGSQLSETHVLVTNFRPTAHFVWRIVIPAVRLQEWEPHVLTSAPPSP
jgi:hypothetical protein